MIEASIITDSIGERSPRLTTFLTRYPKFIHAEHCRHRAMSLCVSSSRAVPVAKNLEEVRSDALRASPVWWGREQKGMQSGEELSYVEKYNAQHAWKQAAGYAAGMAEHLVAHGAHKSIVNRILEPFLHVNVLVTVCQPGLLNFFGLRLDKAAQPEIRVLAEAMWKAWNESTPKKLSSNEWHLPFIDTEADSDLRYHHRFDEEEVIERDKRRISAARCARLSYTSFETGKRSTIEEDLALFNRLLGASPIHASPAEHQATPDEQLKNPHLHGNLPGWIQHRKLLSNEAVAPLPEGYRL